MMFLKYLLCGSSSAIMPDTFVSIIPNPPPGKEPPTVLIIDDSLVYAKLVSKFMQKKGYNTMVAIDGQEGLECIGTLYFNLVISDIHMPRMDGLEFVKTLRKKYQSSIPVILYSTDIYQYNNAMLAGATDFIGKPFTRERLYGVVEKLIPF